MAEPPPPTQPQPRPDDIAKQLDMTAANLRTLAEQLGAVRPGAAAPFSPPASPSLAARIRTLPTAP
jgi:hypothetical protein